MDIRRRRLILTLGASASALVLMPHGAAVAADRRDLFVILTDVTADTPPAQLAAVLDAFLGRGIAVTCALAPETAEGDDLRPESALAAALRARAAAFPDLLEIALSIPALTAVQSYFQMRLAAAARARLLRALDPGDGSGPAAAPWTAVGDLAAYEFVPDGLRSAGLRAFVQRTGADLTEVTTRSPPEPVLFRGGPEAGFAAPAGESPAALAKAIRGSGEAVLFLSMQGLAALPEAGARARAETLAANLGAARRDGRVRTLRPMDRVRPGAAGGPRLIGLVLEAAEDAPAVAGLHALAARLDAAGIAYSIAARTGDEAADRCLILPEATPAGARGKGGPVCALGAQAALDGLPVALRDGIEVLIAPAGAAHDAGMRSDARLQLGPVFRPGAAAGGWPDEGQDGVLVITPEVLRAAAARDAVFARTDAMARAGDAVLDVAGLVRQLRPHDPVYAIFQATRRRWQQDDRVPAPPDAAERQTLIEDARLAWRYFDRLTDAGTGVCASTARERGAELAQNPTLTLWDLGSQIQAIVSAAAIGVIARDEAAARAGQILENLPDFVVDGLRLPAWDIDARSLARATPGFNSCDTGRLLSALARLRASALLPDGAVADKVARWDLAATIRGGRPHNIRRGAWHDVYLSHCTHYTARAMALWGIDLASPWSAMRGESESDARLRLLHEAASISSYGTVPLLLEAVEMGLSPPSDYLTRVLFSAQRAAFEATGTLVCVAEAPLNRPPWFVYQGLRLDLDTRWETLTVENRPEHRTEDFHRKTAMVNTAAAFLWAAAHPHPYSRALLNHVRERARMPGLGFSPGVFSQTGEAMPFYSDVNTNGVILGAIDHMLGGAAAPAGGGDVLSP